MIQKIFSVYDSKGCFFGRPFFEDTELAGIRVFSDAVADNNPNNMWHRHPEDYSLFTVGEFDNFNGKITPHLLKNLVTASALSAVVPEKEKQLELPIK
ncbi:MAG: nonstructural protein [Microviridae sp.]|nr:MAG: nonstructural protein [Microviridae sp.]